MDDEAAFLRNLLEELTPSPAAATVALDQAVFLCAPLLSKVENVHLFLELIPTPQQMPRDVTNISED